MDTNASAYFILVQRDIEYCVSLWSPYTDQGKRIPTWITNASTYFILVQRDIEYCVSLWSPYTDQGKRIPTWIPTPQHTSSLSSGTSSTVSHYGVHTQTKVRGYQHGYQRLSILHPCPAGHRVLCLIMESIHRPR